MFLRSFTVSARWGIVVFGAGLVALLTTLQWTQHAGRRHIKTASETLFPAALKSQQAISAFERVQHEYRNAVVMQETTELASADHDTEVLLSALRGARGTVGLSPRRQEQIASLDREVQDLHQRATVVYSSALVAREGLSPDLQKKLAELAHATQRMQTSLGALQSDLANDFQQELHLIDRLSAIQRDAGTALLVVLVAALLFSARAMINSAAQKRGDEVLRQAHKESEALLNSVPSLLVALDPEGRICRWNKAATTLLGWEEGTVAGQTLGTCGIKWLTPDIDARIAAHLQDPAADPLHPIKLERDQSTRFLGLNAVRIPSPDGTISSLVAGADITEKTALEEQLHQAHKLEAIGQLAAGIAHEINTPTQFVLNNTAFLKEAWDSLVALLHACRDVQKELMANGTVPMELRPRLAELSKKSDLDYLLSETPVAIDQSLEGLQRVARIVKAMKEFSHPECTEKVLTDINKAIETTITVARNEWKYVAEVLTDFDHALPLVPCFQGEFNQAILNLLVNAVHAIADVVEKRQGEKGTITIATRQKDHFVEISIVDTGTGIPEAVRHRIFEPFFTTKPVGRGTGQGLTLAYSTIVKKHQGRMWFVTEMGHGTTFFIQLPVDTALIGVLDSRKEADSASSLCR